MRPGQSFSCLKTVFAAFITILLTLIAAGQPAQAQNYKFKVLHTFHGKDGANPIGQLMMDAAGNFYGTTGEGGSGTCQNFGCGTAFKMNMAGKILWQHSFQGPNGETPLAGLFQDSTGSLFGTTGYGGKINNRICPNDGGCGVVFKLDTDGRRETVLHKFTGPPDGYIPESLLVGDSEGNLYGTTYIGGKDGYGAVFEIDKTGKETILYDFTGGSDGCAPYPGVIRDDAGNLYGVTLIGGAGFCNSGYGVVFKVDPSGNETVLHAFSGSDGANPISVLLFDEQGNLYGTTENGGTSNVCGGGCGTVFELTPRGDGSWSETVLYSFCTQSGCTDGETPFGGPLVRDAKGNIYGTTESGGASSNCNGGGCGVVFKLSAGVETVLHTFTGGADGAVPYGGLTINLTGNLYGAVLEGGDLKCPIGNGRGCGTIFKISP
jgi:uncharacterized repeat protein (TIGR03803 family)